MPEATDRAQRASAGVALERLVSSGGVGGEGRDAGIGCDVASQAPQQDGDPLGIPAGGSDAADVNAPDLIEVAAIDLQRLLFLKLLDRWPPTDRDRFRQIADREPPVGGASGGGC